MEGLPGANYGVQPNAAPASGSQEAATFAARIAISRDFNPIPAPIIQTQVQAPDPTALARAAVEDEIRRKRNLGGGGGVASSKQSYNPTLWVPYSFRLMARAMEENRMILNQLLQQIVNFIPNTLNRIVRQLDRAFANFIGGSTASVANLFAQVQKQSSNLLQAMIRSPLTVAIGLGASVSHIANSIANALTQGMKRLVYGKDEKDEEAFEVNKDQNNIFDSFQNWLKSLKSDSN